MAYKVNEELVIIYQAPVAESGIGASLKYDVYDEAHALDAAKSGTSMTELGTTGRYYATFTPDAVGVWIVEVQKDPDPTGKTIATVRYDVRTLDEDDMLQQSDILSDATPFAGAMITTIKDFVDCLPATLGDLVEKNLAAILSDEVAFVGANIDAAITSRATPAEILVNVANKIDGALIDAAISSRAPAGEYDPQMARIDQELSTTESNIRGAEGDDLKTISDQIDDLSTPAPQAM